MWACRRCTAWARRKEVPARKVGGQWRFTRASLLRWLEGNDEQNPSDTADGA